MGPLIANGKTICTGSKPVRFLMGKWRVNLEALPWLISAGTSSLQSLNLQTYPRGWFLTGIIIYQPPPSEDSSIILSNPDKYTA